MRQAVARIARRITNLRKALHDAQTELRACDQGQRKAAAAAACDTQWKAAAQAAGKADGLKDALAGERRVARTARPLILTLKSAGPQPGGKKALANLKALTVLPGKTARAWSAAKAAAKRTDSALTGCNAALDQG